jgi:hypothetical protein
MSASRPSTLIVDDDDDWGIFSPLSSGASRVPSSTATSGEFNAFAAIGSVAGGGGPSVSCGFSPTMGLRSASVKWV